MILFAMAALSILRPFLKDVKAHGGVKGMLSEYHKPHFSGMQVFPLFMLCLISVMLYQASRWNFDAKIIPMIVGIFGLVVCALSLLNDMFKSQLESFGNVEDAKMHMDIGTTLTHLDTPEILKRGAIFFGWLLAFLGSMATIGLIPTVPIFVVTFMRVEAREPWRIVIPMAAFMTVFIYGLFDQLLAIPWPQTIVGNLFPVLKNYIPSM
jgi:hypothetical protein